VKAPARVKAKRRIHMEARPVRRAELPKGELIADWGWSICSPFPARRARGVFAYPRDAWKFTDDAGKVTCTSCHKKMLAEHEQTIDQGRNRNT